MRFWWVNQNQTFEQEFRGGYLWSPKRNANGARNPYYESMREVAPGDIVFSFCDRTIAAIGIAQSYGYECPKPTEFGTIGGNWEKIGWRVDVKYQRPRKLILPRDHMPVLAPLLPARYAPLLPSGRGIQNIYLTEIPRAFAETLAGLVGPELLSLLHANDGQSAAPLAAPARGIDEWENILERQVAEDRRLKETERKAIVTARRGQGIFKQNVLMYERACRVTRVDNPEHLIGSHIKPWRDSSNDERLDGANGLMLTPSIDHLFDRGFISFENNGKLLVSPVADDVSLRRMGIETSVNVGAFRHDQSAYLEFHRDSVFLRSVKRP